MRMLLLDLPDLLFRLVPTLYDRRNNICRAVLAELRKEFGREVREFD